MLIHSKPGTLSEKNMKHGIFSGFQPNVVKNGNFTTSNVFFTRKIKISKFWALNFFLTIFYYNLAEFQVCRTFLAWLLFENVILSNRDFKLRAAHFWVKFTFFRPNLAEILKIYHVSCFFLIKYLVYYELTPIRII